MSKELLQKIDKLNQIGISLSTQSDIHKLLEKILVSAQELTCADGGTLYLVGEDKSLHFYIIHNSSLNLKIGKGYEQKISSSPIPLVLNGKQNSSAVSAYVANTGLAVNIPDVYEDTEFDFSEVHKFDKRAEYVTRSMLTIPLKDFEGEVMGVLQLINSIDPESRETVPFSKELETFAMSLASQASVALNNRRLIDEHRNLFDSFTKMVANAIDLKSPYTGSHCKRVPVLTMMLARAAHQTTEGAMADFFMDDKDFFALETAAWLHDCGKLVTPDYIMDKSTKLQTIFDRIELLKMRFSLKAYQAFFEEVDADPLLLEEKQNVYQALFERLEKINQGGEFLDQESLAFLEELREKRFMDTDGISKPLISDEEFENLSIQKGTLTDQERQIMQDHVSVTIQMLGMLPFPKDMQNVPEYAGGHHERVDGNGYPKQLNKDQLSIPARIMGIADIFEALSAGDRPYKKAKTLSESLRILGFMCKDGHIDPDLFKLFVKEKIYLEYGKKYLKPEQIDEVDHDKIPGYL